MATAKITKSTRSAKKTTTSKGAGAPARAAGKAQVLHLPALSDLVQRARQVQEQGLAQVHDLRLRIEGIEFNLSLEQRREQIDGMLGQLNARAVELRSELWHRLGLASLEDVEKMTRQLKTVRSKLQGVQRQVRGGRHKDAA